MKILRGLNNALEKFEGMLASMALIFMIGLSFLQVILRNFWDTGIVWGDPIVRALVVWVGFLGASIATRQNGHISLDVVRKFLPAKLKRVTDIFVHWASCVICILLAHAAYKFVLSEKEFGEMLVAKVPNYWAIVIIPISFAIMSVRYFFKGIVDILCGTKLPSRSTHESRP